MRLPSIYAMPHQHLLPWLLLALMLWPRRICIVDADAALQRMTAQWLHKLCSVDALTQYIAVQSQSQSFFNSQRASRERGDANKKPEPGTSKTMLLDVIGCYWNFFKGLGHPFQALFLEFISYCRGGRQEYALKWRNVAERNHQAQPPLK